MKYISYIYRKTISPFVLFIVFAAFLFPLEGTASSGQAVTGKLKVTGNKIVLELQITSPAPEAIIVTEQLPKGVHLTKATPKYSKFVSDKGKVKWLLKGLSPGTHKVTVELEKQVSKKGIKAVLSYRDPSTGTLSRLEITP